MRLDDERSAVHIEATARTIGKTGVEMEALTAVTVAALTIYDMAKAVDRGMRLSDIRLLEKRGGQRGDYTSPDYAAAETSARSGPPTARPARATRGPRGPMSRHPSSGCCFAVAVSP
jgi:hypothetical protein